MNIRTSKEGLKYRLEKIPQPTKDDVVCFTYEEFNWMKKQQLTPAEFKLLWLMKMDDYHAEIVPNEYKKNLKDIAQQYCEDIIRKLKHRQHVEQTAEQIQKSKDPESGEVV